MPPNESAAIIADLQRTIESLRNQNELLTSRIIEMEKAVIAWTFMHNQYRYQIAKMVKLLGIANRQINHQTKGGSDAV